MMLNTDPLALVSPLDSLAVRVDVVNVLTDVPRVRKNDMDRGRRPREAAPRLYAGVIEPLDDIQKRLMFLL